MFRMYEKWRWRICRPLVDDCSTTVGLILGVVLHLLFPFSFAASQMIDFLRLFKSVALSMKIEEKDFPGICTPLHPHLYTVFDLAHQCFHRGRQMRRGKK